MPMNRHSLPIQLKLEFVSRRFAVDRSRKLLSTKFCLSTLLFVGTTARSFSQGHVNFANDPSLLINDPPPNRFVYGTGLSGLSDSEFGEASRPILSIG